MSKPLDPTTLSLLEPAKVADLARMLRADVDTDSSEIACLALAIALIQVCEDREGDLHMVLSTARNMYKVVE